MIEQFTYPDGNPLYIRLDKVDAVLVTSYLENTIVGCTISLTSGRLFDVKESLEEVVQRWKEAVA